MVADLHIHTTASDGSVSPAGVVKLACQKGVTTIAITDHESVAGCQDAVAAGLVNDVEVIPGLELLTSFRGKEVHLLGYYLDLNHTPLLQRLAEIRAERREVARQVVANLQREGFNLSWEEVETAVSSPVVIGKNHIMQALDRVGLTTTREQRLYVLRHYVSERGSAYVPYFGNPLEQAVASIRDAGGVPILAHPALIGDWNLVEEMLEYPVAGLEGYYYYLGPEQEENNLICREIALRRGLLITGGSDFHGVYAPVDLGALPIPEAAVQALRDHYRSCRQEAGLD